jgi:hypothetical protein
MHAQRDSIGSPRWRGLLLALVVAHAAAFEIAAEPLDPARVPEPLRPWIDWALRGHESERCPAQTGGAATLCAWPSRLSLELGERGGSFAQEWQIHESSWVALPGDARHWPEGVRSGGRELAVVERNGGPSVRLAPGRHSLAGSFRWSPLPELLRIPPETALVRVTVDGRELAFARREQDGTLWLRERSETTVAEAESLEIDVQRKLVDEVPTRLVTRIALRVAGRPRERLFGRALPEGFAPQALQSPLPARLEADGRLRVQLRPGVWDLWLAARAEAPKPAIGPPQPEGPWAPSEIWVFEARPALRVVSVEGGEQVDPSQTTLPPAWRNLPAYLLGPGRVLSLVERQRGDADPAADALSLERNYWLDFDGRGYTISDRIAGSVRRSDRLELREPALLGRAALAGRDQQITRRAGAAALGVEVPKGPIALDADARAEDARGRIAAVGWDHDFRSLSAQLHLPPGWRLLHAAGADRAETTWISRWQLFDLFAVLVLAMGVAQLFGRRAGALALAALALCYTEPGAPRWLFAFALGAEALRLALPAGRLQRLTEWLRFAALALLVLASLAFAVSQLRQVMYPGRVGPPVWEQPIGLEQRMDSPQVFAPTEGAPAPGVEESAVVGESPNRVAAERKLASATSVTSFDAEEIVALSMDEGGSSGADDRNLTRYALDPNARLNTGPGLPNWQWTRVALSWSGPVPRDQELRLWLASPALNAVLGVLRIALLALLLARIARGADWSRGGRPRPAITAALVLLSMLGMTPGARAELPSPELLDELRARLLEPPECRPSCAEVSELRLVVAPASLRLELRADAAAPTAIPLPGGAASWIPAQVMVDAAPAVALARDAASGAIWVGLAPGHHRVVALGALPERSSLELALPLRPRRVQVEAEGWSVSGVRDDGTPDASLQLTRLRAAGEERSEPTLAPGQLPPFARVQRRLVLALDWSVATVVRRDGGAPDSALTVEIPLLPGESVTSADVRVAQGIASVTLPPGSSAAAFDSTLAVQENLTLGSPVGAPWIAVWQLDASPTWHVDSEGVPPIHSENALREWRLWPGEPVRLQIARPEAAPGATLTFDRVALSAAPGLRATDTSLALTLRSSLGGEHRITLPEGAELTSAAIDGNPLPLRQDGAQVVLPITPGRHEAALAWREPRGIAGGLVYRGPALDLGQESVNAELSLAPPQDRWLLFARGPSLGPAVLFWPMLGIFTVVAFGLARVPHSPLRAPSWWLLGLGLTQVPVAAAALVALWLLALGWRGARGAALPNRAFDLAQVALVLQSAAALVALFVSVQRGLLGLPEMQIAGNGSTAWELRWYQDRSDALLPQPSILSVPLWVYRGLMLAWSLWLAISLVGWLRTGARAFTEGGVWKPLRRGSAEAARNG